MMDGQLVLLYDCPAANCRNQVPDPREMCVPCQVLFTGSIRPAAATETAEQFVARQAAADARLAEIMAGRRQVVKMNRISNCPACGKPGSWGFDDDWCHESVEDGIECDREGWVTSDEYRPNP